MKSLLSKILVSLLASVLIALAIVALLTRMNLHSGMLSFVEQQESLQLANLVPELSELYQENGSWDFLRNSPRQWNQLLRMTRPTGSRVREMRGNGAERPPGPPRRDRADGAERPRGERPSAIAPGAVRPPRELVNLKGRLFLLDENRNRVAGAVVIMDEQAPMQAIEIDGRPVGWLGFNPVRDVLPPEAQQFLHGQARTLGISLLIALGFAAVLGFLLARHISRPVRQLASAVAGLRRGDFNARAPVHTRDEIGELGRNVNQLAETLEKNRTMRRRWMADIAHELRTPISVLKGEIEALEDGIRPLDQNTRNSLREEADQLARLIDDLQTLALSDAGALDLRIEPVNFSELLLRSCNRFTDRMTERKIVFKADITEEVWLDGDPQRLRQLVHNLMENCYRYVESQGQVKLELRARDGRAELILDDSGPGLQAEQLSRLFERFYRAEESRSRVSGGSGLGLSICRNIVEAHGGVIGAESSSQGGLCVRISLPAR